MISTQNIFYTSELSKSPLSFSAKVSLSQIMTLEHLTYEYTHRLDSARPT